ncbi:MAG TPA: peptidase MA family metallohydrolase, partial [Myxococcota bacterium]
HLANAYEDQNDHQNAISAWQRVNEEKPSPAIEAHIASLEKKAGAEKGFAHITHEHFEVHFEGDSDRALAEQALDNLDEAWRTIGDKLDLHPPAPLLVIFYGGDKYKDATGAPDWSGGVFDGKIRVRENSLRISRGDVRDLLFHEYTHALLHTTVKGEIPAWMNEGLAQHMEPGISHARIDRLKKIDKEHLPRVASLRQSFSRFDAATADVAYGSAQDLVNMLGEWRGERSYADLFASMNGGKSFDDAVDDVYSLTPDLVESRWRSRF